MRLIVLWKLFRLSLPQLRPAYRDLLEANITATDAISLLKPNKSLGLYGLTAEFYF